MKKLDNNKELKIKETEEATEKSVDAEVAERIVKIMENDMDNIHFSKNKAIYRKESDDDVYDYIISRTPVVTTIAIVDSYTRETFFEFNAFRFMHDLYKQTDELIKTLKAIAYKIEEDDKRDYFNNILK